MLGIQVYRRRAEVGEADKLARRSKLGKIERLLSMTANVVVIAGIFIAVFQLYQARVSEKAQNAINAINQTRSSDFLRAYARLKTAYNSKNVGDAASLIDDLNYVMNTYDHIALLYMNNLANRCVIKNATYLAITEISPICDSMSYPKEYRKNFDKLLVLMDKDVCE